MNFRINFILISILKIKKYLHILANLKEDLKSNYTYIYVINENKQYYEKCESIFGEDINLQENSLYQIIKQDDEIYLKRILIRDIIDY